MIKCVEEFHNKFEIENNYEPTIRISEGDKVLRFDLMDEENEEYLQAARSNDLVEVADALGDMLYILCGTILKHGMQDRIVDVFKEIQRSNMSKLDENGKVIKRDDGKILKSNLYSKPNLTPILYPDVLSDEELEDIEDAGLNK